LGSLPWPALLVSWAGWPDARPNIERFLSLQGACPDITGDDLVRAGYTPSPGFRAALQAAWRAKLDQDASAAEQLAIARAVLQDWELDAEG
jgi:hypothetical protein